MNQSIRRYVIALLLFGSNGIIASTIHMNSYEIVMFRTLMESILLISLCIISNHTFGFYKYKQSFLFLILSGISMGVSWLFLYKACQQVGVSIASLGYYCGPILVMAISPILFKEPFSKQKLICFIIVFIGILLVNENTIHESHTSFDIFCSFMSALMYACMVTFNKKAEEIKGIEKATVQLTVASLSVFIFVLFKQGLSFSIQSNDFLPLIFLGFVNTEIGCSLYFSSIGEIKVQTVAILGYLEPLSAVLFSFLF